MLRIPSVSFGSGCHAIEGAAFLRSQLWGAELAPADGETPTLSVLIDELVTIGAISRADGRLPFEHRKADVPFRSLSVDLDRALGRLGARLARLIGHRLATIIDPNWRPAEGGPSPPWPNLLAEAETIGEQLQAADALIAAFDDALEAATVDDPRVAFESVAACVSELRGIATRQGRAWEPLRNTIADRLTIEHTDDDGHAIGGFLPEGAPPEQVLERVHEALRTPAPMRDFAVWISALTGPGPRHDPMGPSVVAGPIAVSRVVCVDDVGGWIKRVRAELTDAFASEVGEVPPDVKAFGEPSRYRGQTMYSGEELWADMATPPSFVARVAVRASHRDEASRKAFQALRAVYELVSPELAQSLRSDVVFWTDRAGWFTSGTTARGRSLGETFAARRAAQAVSIWAEDLGTPLDDGRLDLLRARALVANPATAPEIRVMRAFSSLEAIAPAGGGFDDLTRRLALRTAWADARSLLDHLLARTRDKSMLRPAAEGTTHEDARARLVSLEARIADQDDLGWDMRLLDAIDAVLGAVHSNAVLPALARAAREQLQDPLTFSQAFERHEAAFKRARRHRNLVVHGHRLSESALIPTATFLSRQLGLAIDAHHADTIGSKTRWLGSLATRPDTARGGRTMAELLDAVS